MDMLRTLYWDVMGPFYGLADDEEAVAASHPLAELALLAGITVFFGYHATCEFVAVRETVL